MLNTGDGLFRQTNLVAANADITILMRFTPKANIAGVDYRAVFAYIDAAPGPTTIYTKYFGIYGYLIGGQQRYSVEVNNGSGSVNTSTFTLTTGAQYNLAYIRKGNVHFFQIHDTVVGSITLDLTGTIWNSAVAGGDGYTGAGGHSVTNVDIAYYREFNRALTVIEVVNEFQSSSAYSTNIVSDTPLISNGLDISGGGNTWSNIATVGTFVNNTLPASPIVVPTAFPYSRVVTQAEFNASNLIWFKFTNPTNLYLGSYTNSGGTFVPKTFMYLSDANTLLDTFTNDAFYKTIGPGDYYFKILRNPIGASNFDFTTEFDIALVAGTVPENAVIVNDDTQGQPATMWDTTTGELIGIWPQIPGGEMGTSLPDGTSMWHDRYNNYRIGYISVFDNNLTYIATIDTVPSIGNGADASAMGTDGIFMYVVRTADGKLWKVTRLGVITDTGITVAGFTRGIGISKDATILYWSEGFASPSIHRWSMVTNTAMSDLYTVPLGGHTGFVALTNLDNHNGEILTFADGSIATWWVDTTTDQHFIIHVSAAGALINQWEMTGTYKAFDHINYTTDDNLIRVWLFDALNENGKLAKLNLTTGVLTEEFIAPLFSTGANQVNGDPNMFGRSISCVMISVNYPSGGGNPPPPLVTMPPISTPGSKHTDSTLTGEVAIPTPQFKTALLGN